MKRLIDYQLQEWKNSPLRKPLLLEGARQVGKTYAVRKLGTLYPDFLELNFEHRADAIGIFEKNLDPERIIRDIFSLTTKTITPGKTLLFFDEIQNAPKAILALRYFYEMMPDLHVIAAGSLIGFATELVGLPVGRVSFLAMYPLSFLEFLTALGHRGIVEEILNHDFNEPMNAMIHQITLGLLGEYLAVGGMPSVVNAWRHKQGPQACMEIHQSIIKSYRQDFGKYATKYQIKYLDALFKSIPLQLSQKFKFSSVSAEYRKRELLPALELLCKADVASKVFYSAGQALPIGGAIDPEDFKVLLLDIGINQAMLGLNLSEWFLNPEQALVNKGALVEAFVGQEFLVYNNPAQDADLYYWHRRERGSEAEIDYLVQQGEYIIPVEVKSGKGTALKSMHMFLESHGQSPYGIRFSIQNYSVYEKVHSYPLYAIAKIMPDRRKAFDYLTAA